MLLHKKNPVEKEKKRKLDTSFLFFSLDVTDVATVIALKEKAKLKV